MFNFERIEPDTLWRYYQRGYLTLVRSGLYFRQVLRPALSHVYFKRAVPILIEYARANHRDGGLPPGFGEQMEACPLTPRDLLHLDYAICLGYSEMKARDTDARTEVPVLSWPGPGGNSGIFVAADAIIYHQDLDEFEELEQEFDGDFDDEIEPTDFEDDDEDREEGGGGSPPFDL